MQNVAGFNKKRWASVLALAITAYVAWKAIGFSLFFGFEESIIRREKINNNHMLYITEGSAGATTAFVYQYYVVPAGITDKEFLKGVNDEYPSFLSTSDRDAKVEIEGSSIRLSVPGNVYKFHNGTSYAITIHLNAAPY